MQELIKVTEAHGQKVVSARDLHAFLESKKQFADWIKNRIAKYDLVEGQDFTTFHQMVNRSKATEYALKLDTAKELAMVEGNAKGKEARRYFIECERIAQAAALPVPKTQGELILMIAHQNVEQEKRLQEMEQRQLMLEAKVNTSTTNYFSVMGYATLKGVRVGYNAAISIGQKARALSLKKNLPIESVPDPRFGKVNTYASEILDQVFSEVKGVLV